MVAKNGKIGTWRATALGRSCDSFKATINIDRISSRRQIVNLLGLVKKSSIHIRVKLQGEEKIEGGNVIGLHTIAYPTRFITPCMDKVEISGSYCKEEDIHINEWKPSGGFSF